jgi:hypothetical protein
MQHEYGVSLTTTLRQDYDAIVVAVNHDEFAAYNESYFKTLLKDGKGILVDVKGTYRNQIKDGYEYIMVTMKQWMGQPTDPLQPMGGEQPGQNVLDKAIPPQDVTPAEKSVSKPIVEKILPNVGAPEVFNISKNTFTYYDAEPLCRALGAELATYDQVKEAWERGADWCNYGWVKGQMAVYPTQQDTWEQLQQGPEDQRDACGRPGLNGGFFDNPELRFGVNCYGVKPSQKDHDATAIASGEGAPLSPEGLEFENTWTNGIIYQPGDIVTYGGYAYISKTNNIEGLAGDIQHIYNDYLEQ